MSCLRNSRFWFQWRPWEKTFTFLFVFYIKDIKDKISRYFYRGYKTLLLEEKFSKVIRLCLKLGISYKKSRFCLIKYRKLYQTITCSAVFFIRNAWNIVFDIALNKNQIRYETNYNVLTYTRLNPIKRNIKWRGRKESDAITFNHIFDKTK